MTNRELVPQFDLADRMRKALRTSDLGVQDMADYLGVARSTVGKWINGHINPSKQSLRLWAMRTGVDFNWLVTGQSPHQLDADEGFALLPRLDSNQKPAGYWPERTAWTELRREDLAAAA